MRLFDLSRIVVQLKVSVIECLDAMLLICFRYIYFSHGVQVNSPTADGRDRKSVV